MHTLVAVAQGAAQHKDNGIIRISGAGDGNRIASQIFKPHRNKVLPASV